LPDAKRACNWTVPGKILLKDFVNHCAGLCEANGMIVDHYYLIACFKKAFFSN
jgi:hypothetical protein